MITTIRQLFLFLFLTWATGVSAAVVEVADTQNQTERAQLFNFNFNPLPASDGSGGLIEIDLVGDYSERDNTMAEGVTITFDGVDGKLALYNDVWGGDGVFLNTIDGLTLNNQNKSGASTNWHLFYQFDLSGQLLDSLLAGGGISAAVQLGYQVDYASVEQTVGMGFQYQSDMSAVPLPAAAWLFGSAILGLGAIKRKRA